MSTPGTFSKLTYSWCFRILQLAQKDLLSAEKIDTAQETRCEKFGEHSSRLSYLSALSFGKTALLKTLCFGFFRGAITLFSQFFILQSLFKGLNDSSFLVWQLWCYAGVFFCCQCFQSLLENWYMDTNTTGAITIGSGLQYYLAKNILTSKTPAKNSSRLVGFNLNVIRNFVAFFPWSFIAPINVFGSLASLYFLIGWTAFPLLGLVILTTTSSTFLGKLDGKWLPKLVKAKDNCLESVRECMVSIFDVKTQGLEDEVISEISEKKRQEIAYHQMMLTVKLCVSVVDFVERSLGPSILLYGIPIGIASSTLSLASIYVSFPIVSFFLLNVGYCSTVLFSLSRFKSCFCDFSKLDIGTWDETKTDAVEFSNILVVDACFRAGEFELKHVSFELKSGDWLFLFGESGSGKSVLLKGMMETGGVSGSVSFFEQNPWLFKSSIRKNILFGRQFDAHLFEKVIDVVGLVTDFSSMVEKDMYKVSAGGKNLSGGQRARVTLARTLYANCQIILMDDPLSALDSIVAEKVLFCLRDFLRSKIVILASSQRYAPIQGEGVLTIKKGEVESLMQPKSACDSLQCGLEKHEVVSLDSSFRLLDFEIVSGKRFPVSWRDWLFFLKSMGIFVATSLLFLFCREGLLIFSSFWITFWLQGVLNMSQQLWLLIYSMLFFGSLVAEVLAFVVFWSGSIMFSIRTHKQAVSGISFTSIATWAGISVGEILSRFSNDIPVLDAEFPGLLFGFILVSGASLIGVLVVAAYIFPVSLAALPVLIFVSIAIFLYFRHGNLVLKRMERSATSEVISVFEMVISGLFTIEVFGGKSISLRTCVQAINLHASINYIFWMTQRWFSLRIQMIAAFFGFFTSVIAILVGGSFGALFLSYTLQLGSGLQFFLRNLLNLESFFVSVSRILEYCSLESEHKDDASPCPKDWPSLGRVEFSNVSLSYGPNLPQVVRNLNLVLENGKSFGVVGRTGAGKSSIFNLLLCMYPFEGEVFVDGIKLKSLQKSSFRSKFSFVGQEPAIFRSWSVRRNIDPFGQAQTNLISEVLSFIFHKFEFNLDELISKAISSKGEKQKICLVRAVVQGSKIFCLDEGTSSLDAESSSVMDNLLDAHLKSSTKVMIAHQLATVMKCDSIIVMDKGKIAEFDHPKTLLERGGIFKNLVDAWGEKESKKLSALSGEATEDWNCNICRQIFSRLRSEIFCAKCNHRVCKYCQVDSECMKCLDETGSLFHLKKNCAVFLDPYEIVTCKACESSFCRSCGTCDGKFCDACLVYTRDVWNARKPHFCKNCWVFEKEKLLSEAEFGCEAQAEVFHAENFSMNVEKITGSCIICRKKGVCVACTICSSYVCYKCSGWLFEEKMNPKAMILSCARCSSKKSFSRPLYGECPAFFSITEEQLGNIVKQEICCSCNLPFSFFLQPYKCKSCTKLSCRKCFLDQKCELCRSGKNETSRSICDGCKLPCDTIVWVNYRQFHPECVSKFKVQETCAYCGEIALKSQGTCLFNNFTVHAQCLIPFKKNQQK